MEPGTTPLAPDAFRDVLRNRLHETFRDQLVYESEQWKTGSVLKDPFYSVKEDTANAAPGSLLKVEESTSTKIFTLPPATALSRIIYQSKTLRDDLVPVSAYILWPYSPRPGPDGYQVVAWAHGTCGLTAECAPSHFKDLWQHFLAPYQLALQGYVVVATDYSGLGVSKTALGRPIIHEYLASPSHANDVFYSVQAARQAFRELSKFFVRQAVQPVDGYLGTIPISPVTSVLKETDQMLPLLISGMIPGMCATFPEFNRKEVITPECEHRLDWISESGPIVSTALASMLGVPLLQPRWKDYLLLHKYLSLVSCGGKEVSGPMLVIHGEADPDLDCEVTTAAVEKTTSSFSLTQLKYVTLPGVLHDGAMMASQWIWMDWIAEKFSNVMTDYYIVPRQPKCARPIETYQPTMNWILRGN